LTDYLIYTIIIAYPGKVAEWFMAAVLKTADVKASVGSNPTLSVIKDTVLNCMFEYSNIITI